MRVYSLVFMLGLILVAGAVYANGAVAPVEPAPPMEIPAPAPPMEAPAPVPPAETPTQPAEVPSVTICPPVGAGATCAAEVESFNRNNVARQFNISQSTIADLRTRHDWPTIYFMANVAARAGCPITQVAGLFEQGMSCADIAARYNIAMSDLTVPAGVTTAVAVCPPLTGMGPGMPSAVITDRYGNVILSQMETERLLRQGYTREDIAVAANIAAQTGFQVHEVIRGIDGGATWSQVAWSYGLGTCFDIEQYLAPVGAGPECPCPATCPQECPKPGAICPPECPCPDQMPSAPAGAGPSKDTAPMTTY